MRKAIWIGVMCVWMFVLAVAPSMALQAGTWDCMGYTITVTPDDPDDPNKSGSITITKSDEYADVDISGLYWKKDGKKPALVVEIGGTIETPDGIMEVNRTFTFSPGPKRTVWKTILSWIESQISG